MTEASDRSWKKPQNVEELANSTVQKPNKQPEDNNVSGTWAELSNHPSWNNLFHLLEDYIDSCNKSEKKSRHKDSDRDTTVKKVSIRKKYKKYKKRYKLIKNETSRTSDSGYECTPKNENPTNVNYSN